MAIAGRPAASASDPRGLGALLKDLAEGSGELIRHEVRLARTEARELIRGLGTGTAEVAAGALLALLGGLARRR